MVTFVQPLCAQVTHAPNDAGAEAECRLALQRKWPGSHVHAVKTWPVNGAVHRTRVEAHELSNCPAGCAGSM